MRISVKNQIDQEEARSETIAVIAQLAFLALIFGVYLLSPKGFEENHESFKPVPIWFSIYGPILLLRFALLLKGGVNKLALYLFIVIDTLALCALIFSFHIQYQQPVTLSLRSPTFTFFFSLLALRCLSYNPINLILAGASAALGWIGIVAYSLHQPEIRLTHKFADYLQPNTVILGVEVEKVLSILFVAGFLGASVYRKRILLERFALKNVRESIMEQVIGRRNLGSFAPELSDLIPGYGVRRQAATLMVDLRGFSKLTYELSAERLLKYLAEYQGIVSSIIYSNGGSVDKYLGDGVLAHFGAVADIPEYARRALEAAAQIQAALHSWAEEKNNDGVKIGFGIAVTVGEVIFGVIGSEEKMEITILGESVNLSAKLEKHTKIAACSILTTLKTHEMAKAQGMTILGNLKNFPGSKVEGIPHSLDLIGFGFENETKKR